MKTLVFTTMLVLMALLGISLPLQERIPPQQAPIPTLTIQFQEFKTDILDYPLKRNQVIFPEDEQNPLVTH